MATKLFKKRFDFKRKRNRKQGSQEKKNRILAFAQAKHSLLIEVLNRKLADVIVLNSGNLPYLCTL